MTDPVTKETDSRLRGTFRRETHPVLPLERTFCSNCGKPKGWVSVDSNNNWLTEDGASVSPAQVIVLCDDCEEKFGDPNLVRVNIREI